MKSKYEINNWPIFCEEAHHIFDYPSSFHQRIEIMQIIKGELHLCIDEKEEVLKPGDISVCFPLVNHSIKANENVILNFVFFPPEICPSFSKLLKSSKPVSPYIYKDMSTPLLQSLISAAVDPGSVMTAERQTAYLNAILAEIIAILPMTISEISNSGATASILTYCSEHFTEDISLKQISKALYLSPQHISYIFTNKLKCNLRTYINTLRIEKAKQLLPNPALSITDIMFECGYKNQSTFNRAFQNLCGTTPLQFRERL